jgi:hypothetical protein
MLLFLLQDICTLGLQARRFHRHFYQDLEACLKFCRRRYSASTRQRSRIKQLKALQIQAGRGSRLRGIDW